MLNIEKGRGNKPIRLDSNIILDAGIQVGAISPYQRSVRLIVNEDVRKLSTNISVFGIDLTLQRQLINIFNLAKTNKNN